MGFGFFFWFTTGLTADLVTIDAIFVANFVVGRTLVVFSSSVGEVWDPVGGCCVSVLVVVVVLVDTAVVLVVGSFGISI